MESISVERLDHLGVLAEVIKDLGTMDMINTRLKPDQQEKITAGEAIAGMILNGLRFSNRPLSLTPQFFGNTPLDLLFREGVHRRCLTALSLVVRSMKCTPMVVTYCSEIPI
jgi:hypothetical protein